jgi:Flp pilus assembly protein TadD
MKAMFASVSFVLLAAAFFIGGCTTDMPIVSNERASRVEGIELYNRTDYENAMGAFRNAVKQDPRDFRSHYYLGMTYERQANYQQAIQAYKSALKVLRELPGAKDYADFRQAIMNTLASCICKHDDNGLEQDLLAKQAADLKTDSQLRAEDYFLLAKVQRYRRDADSALNAYFKASALDRNDYWLQKEAGLYMLQMGKKFTAAKPLQRAAQLNSRDPEVNAALRSQGLPMPKAIIHNENGAQPLLSPAPLPAVDLKVGDPINLPEQLPVT